MKQHTDMDQLAINTIRMLAIDAVQKAKSGHPGTPMDAAHRLYAVADACCATTRQIRAGSTAIASCCRPATPRCCCTA